ncbi:MAG: PTS transporter subunit EIIC [Enterococcus lemanii]|jgi:PTS system mannitol-specific IIC component
MEAKQAGARSRVQAFGGFLTAMVIPNMGAFMTWGFLTALFFSTGWLPNADLSALIAPMSWYLLPGLIAYGGGRLVHGERGGVVGAVAAFGLMVGSKTPMFLGAMVMGPVAAWLLKQIDRVIEEHTPNGFEMVINNFTIALLGLALCLIARAWVGPAISSLNRVLSIGAKGIVSRGLLPLLAVINEPSKVLFLNNMIDQSVYYPLGVEQTLAFGKSIFFTVASNPGAGLGLLLAFALFGQGEAKTSAPGAMIIHFLGGIHEIYFPYVLMQPITLIGMIAGSACGITVFESFGVGLVAGPSPGSIFAYLAFCPKGDLIGVMAGVGTAAAVSFLVNAALIRWTNLGVGSKKDRFSPAAGTVERENGYRSLRTLSRGAASSSIDNKEKQMEKARPIRKVIFACDAGLGSSAMGSAKFKKRARAAGLQLEINHYAIEKVPDDADVIITQKNLGERAQLANPGKRIVTIQSFSNDPNLDTLFEEIVKQHKEKEE